MAESTDSTCEDKLVKTLPYGAFDVLSRGLLPPAIGRDWRSLADLMGFSVEDIRYFSAGNEDPVLKTLTTWASLRHDKATTTKLIEFLRQLGRLDVVEDLEPFIGKCYL